MPGEERNDDYRRLISAWMDGQSGRGRRASRHVTPARRAPVACRFHCSAEPCRSRAFRASRCVLVEQFLQRLVLEVGGSSVAACCPQLSNLRASGPLTDFGLLQPRWPRENGCVLRALTVTALLVLAPYVASGQTLSVLHIRIVLMDAEQKPVPVARHALLISDNPATTAPAPHRHRPGWHRRRAPAPRQLHGGIGSTGGVPAQGLSMDTDAGHRGRR